MRPIHALGWTRLRRASYVAYLVTVVVIVVASGVPTDRGVLAALIVTGLLLTAGGARRCRC